MPSNGKFGFSILVGGKVLSEYSHPEEHSRLLVESILWAPVTYYVEIKEFCKFSDEIECQKWPVTPYEIKVYTEPWCFLSYYKVYVDGVKVAQMFLYPNQSKIIKGFPAKDGNYNEFLFSLPRFAESETDRVETKRAFNIGKIEVVRHFVLLSHNEMRPAGYSKDKKKIDFTQANKKDVDKVTNKEYCMTTTRRGKLLREGKPYDPPKDSKRRKEKEREREANPDKMVSVPIYDIGDEIGKVHVEYHMTQTLLDWGISLVRPDWPTIDLGTVIISDKENETASDVALE